VETLFFELASENRLGILRELQSKPLRMQDVVQKLDMNDTEVFRQLHRLSEALLIKRQPEGTYAITEYGKLVLRLSLPLHFAYRNRQNLLTRDVWGLPDEFIDRLGELSEAKVSTDVIEIVNLSGQGIAAAQDHIWVMSDKPLDSARVKVEEQVSKGIKLRFLFPENQRPLFKGFREVPEIVEKRTLPRIPVNLVCTEKVAGVSLLSIDQRPDIALFFGTSGAFLNWASDLFLHYWNQGHHTY